MNGQTILLALSGADEVRIFTDFLTGCGFDVTAAGDGASALEAVIASTPALVITEPELPVISGDRVFQIIRHNPNTSRVPFLFISDSVSDIKGFHTGVDVFLVRPLNLEEVRTRIFSTLRTEGAPRVESTDIEGRLSHISVADILQFLQLNSKEGELQIRSGATTGKVFVKDGQVYNAVTGGVEKEKALFRMLALEDGKFEFIPRQISISRKVKGSTGSVLMEGMRQIDEYRKRRDQLPDAELHVALTPAAGVLPPDFARPVFQELVTVAGSRSQVADIVEHCSWPDYEALTAIQAMISRGLMKSLGYKKTADPGELTIAVDSDGRLVTERTHQGAGGASRDGKGEVTANQEATAAPGEFLTKDQAISIREKIITRFADSLDLSFARVLAISTNGTAAASFVRSLARIGGMRINHRASSLESSSPNPLGEVASYKLYGGMDLVITSVPSVSHLGPVYTAFSTNLIGVVLIFDDASTRELKDLLAARRELSKGSTAPVAYIYAGESASDDDKAFFRKNLELTPDEPVFTAPVRGAGTAREALYSIFSRLLKEEQPAGTR